MKYRVVFTQSYEYIVDIDIDEDFDCENEAIEKAYKEFKSDMLRPIAHTSYDNVEIEEC